MAETELKGKIALVTGAGSGIGQAAAWALARRGVSVALAGREENKLLETAAQISYEGGDAVTLVGDVTDPAQVARLVTETTRAFDGLDILINSAGAGLIKPLETTTADEIDRLLAVNVKGTMLATQAAVRAMGTSSTSRASSAKPRWRTLRFTAPPSTPSRASPKPCSSKSSGTASKSP